MRSSPIVLGIAALLATTLAACEPSDDTLPASTSVLGDDAITVASFDFAESHLLAEIYAQALEAAGYEVDRALDLGPRELVAPALVGGLVEFVPEYAGSALRFIRQGAATSSDDVDITRDRLVEALGDDPVTVLEPAPAENANAFVVTRETAEAAGLRTISDLREIAGDLTFGGPPECTTRSLCLVGLEDLYGVTFDNVVALDSGGPLTRQALRDGGVDVALLFSSDPSLVHSDFVELVDDLGLQPAENITPIVRREVTERWGDDLVETIDGVSARLTEVELRVLNGLVDEGVDVASVARGWLRQQDLV
jgi:osmoprotectant transport system substrate-binding protein